MRSCVLSLILSLLCAWPVRADEADVALSRPLSDALSVVVDRADLAFAESPAYYSLLEHVRCVPAAALAKAARSLLLERRASSREYADRPPSEFPTFVDMIDHPDEYRGRPVTLRGHVIRLVKYPAGPNNAGIDTLYEAWLVSEHSQQHPSTIICTEIPEGMPIGEELIDGVSVSGYFFKLHTYPSRDKQVRFAPLILAHTPSWHPPGMLPVGELPPAVQYGGLMVLALALCVAAWMSARRHRRVRERRLRESLPDKPPDFLKSLSS
jgi:hypothetical protein